MVLPLVRKGEHMANYTQIQNLTRPTLPVGLEDHPSRRRHRADISPKQKRRYVWMPLAQGDF